MIETGIDLHDPKHLDALAVEQLDALPVGTIRVDSEGRILFYSRTEAALTGRDPQQVLGRNFFTEIAPCTVVPEFYGRFLRGVVLGHLHATFEFVFDFAMQPVQVRITMRDSEQPDEYWIIVEPIRKLPSADRDSAASLIAQKFGSDQESDAADTVLSTASFDFSVCDKEPITTCGAVQPFAALLALDAAGRRIEVASANTGLFLGLEAETLLGRDLADALPELAEPVARALEDIGRRGAPRGHIGRLLVRLPGAEEDLEIRIHHEAPNWLLEIEFVAAMPMDSLLMREDIGSFERALLDCQTVERASQIAVNAMQELSGYERVIVYRFEPDNDGVVIAEAVVTGTWTPILGLRYPATDIPRQSRELCLRTALRYAPTRDYPTIPLLSHDLAVDQLDIGAAHVRAQAPIFRNYLQRFNVIGNMSLSLLQDGRLWGLLIAHHRAPHHVTPGVRRRLSALANLLSVRVALLEERAHAQATLLAAERVTKLPLRIDSEQPFPDCMAGRAGLLRDLVDADGVQIWHEGKPFFPAGELGLDGAQQHALYEFLEARTEPLWETDCLSGHFEPAAAYAEHVAGVLAVNIAGPSRTLLALFRGRQPYTVRWGADPSSLPLGGDERPFGWPNRTFQEWQEERTVHAPAWSQLAVETARALGSLIQQIIAAYASYYERLAETLDVQREELQFRALHDTLTGLPNRVALNQALTRIIAKSGEQGCHFSVALLDIDYFKTINDTLGHDCGDLLLQALTTRVQGALPVGGEMARLGGDEFALVLPGGTPESMEAAAREIVECVRDPIEYQGEQFAVTVSLGLVHGDAGSEPGELLKKADLALYRCKDSGRNCSKVYDPSMSEASSQMLRIGRTLNERSADDAVVLHLQPILPIAAVGPVKRFEVLSRWRNLDGSLVPPAEFIPAAQRNGLIRAVTSSVLRKSIELLKRHLDAGGEECLLAVNVSATDLETRRFSRQILEALHTADVPSECLEIEITESVLLQITPTVVESLRILDRGGVRLSLDDFGTGFSSIKYLRELPISTVKIDRQFVSDVTQPDDYNLVRGMIAMAQSIGKEVVAEGVETEAQLEVLRALGCDWGQGYLWARPAPAAKVLDRTGGATTA